MDRERGVVGVYLPHDPDGTRVEHPLPDDPWFLIDDRELIEMLTESAEKSIS